MLALVKQVYLFDNYATIDICCCESIAIDRKRKHGPIFPTSLVAVCVGVKGFEPSTPCSQSRCANRTALHPVAVLGKCDISYITDFRDAKVIKKSKSEK